MKLHFSYSHLHADAAGSPKFLKLKGLQLAYTVPVQLMLKQLLYYYYYYSSTRGQSLRMVNFFVDGAILNICYTSY